MYVVDEAYAPLSNGVKSVSLEYMMMSSSGTPSTSAAIWPSTVSDPVPRSVAPTRQLNEPSSFILIDAAPISRYGIAVPCITQAMPMPLRRWGLPGTACHSGLLNFRAQSIARRALRHALRQRAGLDDLRPRLAAFAPRAAERMLVAGAHGILQTELDRIDAQLARDAFHVHIHRERALRHAVTAKGSGGRRVGVDDVGVEANVGNRRIAFGRLAGIQRHRFVAGVARDGERMTAIRAGIAERIHRSSP